jgi:hypothetical protein
MVFLFCGMTLFYNVFFYIEMFFFPMNTLIGSLTLSPLSLACFVDV